MSCCDSVEVGRLVGPDRSCCRRLEHSVHLILKFADRIPATLGDQGWVEAGGVLEEAKLRRSSEGGELHERQYRPGGRERVAGVAEEQLHDLVRSKICCLGI